MCLQLLLLLKTRQHSVSETDLTFSIENDETVETAKQAFGFPLTNDQEQCLQEILSDLKKETPMLRILQGDVGTGKTIVAFLAMFATFGSGPPVVSFSQTFFF